MKVEQRPISSGDEEFLYRVYASTRQEEMAETGWTASDIDEFLRMQFQAQHAYYQESLPPSDFMIVLLNGKAAGRLYLGRWEQGIRIVDITLLPEYRNQGIGTELISEIIAEAKRAGKPVHLNVEKVNPALRLYERLGFKVIEDKDVSFCMEWKPEKS